MSDPDEDTHQDLSSDDLPTYFSVITGTLNVSWGYTKTLENRFKVQVASISLVIRVACLNLVALVINKFSFSLE